MDPQAPPVQTISSQAETPQPPITEQKKTTDSKLPLILVCTIALLTVLFGIYFFTQRSTQLTISLPTTQATPQLKTSPQPTVDQPSPAVKADETAGWKKITNKNGFSFMYPDTIEVLAGAAIEEKPEISTIITIREKGVAFDGPQMRIGLWDSINEKSESLSYPSSFSEFANIWYESNVKNPNVPVTIIEVLHEATFQGKSGYEFTFNCKGFNSAPIDSIGPTGICRIIFINNNGIFYSIGFYKNTIFDKIFSTFKFE